MSKLPGNSLFGDWGEGPRGSDPDVQYEPTPVGVPCLECDEPIQPGDVGEFMPLHGEGQVTVNPIHRECLMLAVVGHIYGVCNCTDWAGTATRREAALELARRADSGIPPSIASEIDWKNAQRFEGTGQG